jgi:MarR family transcriptional regulator, organic hydroperoxide resistance regulator
MGKADDDRGFEEFVAASNELFAAMRRNRGRLAHRESSLSLSQLALLEAVATHGPLLVGQIASHAGVSGPTATKMLKQLERQGVVVRQRSRDDERKVLVALTERGRGLVSRQRNALRDKQRKHYATLSPEQREVFVDVLRQMATMVRQWGSDDGEDAAGR